MAVISGNPAAVYEVENPNGLMYVRAGDQAGSSWESGEQVDIYFNYAIPIANINGHPAIAFIRNGFAGDDLMFLIYY